MYEKKNESVDVQNQFSKDHMQKIESLKNIKYSNPAEKYIQNKSNAVEKKPPPIPMPNNSGVNSRRKEEVKKQEVKKE